MEKKLKEKIDSIWMNSDFGKWCIAVSKGDKEKADEIENKAFNAGYVVFSMLEDELVPKIAEALQKEEDVDEYLQMLECENPELVDVLIKSELFYDVSNMLKK